jgi:mono/diheme cytochrome c family protein/glucose/arabinose dehydrogenase
MGRSLSVVTAALCCGAPASAQMGDRAGEEQPPLPPELVVPAAPALAPEDELASFQVAAGFRVELVAAEPLVHDPVRIAWDERGRLWVVEMRGFMPDVDGAGEDAAVGSIAVLEDDDGDGRMDRRTVFLDELVLPRGVAPCRGGALVMTPPDLLFCRDTDGDGRADDIQVVDTGLEGIYSPEHAPNGLLWSLDGAFHNARADWSYRFVGGAWVRERTAGGGQWGIGQDDTGRFFYNTNSTPLFADYFPSHYAIRNPNHGRAAGVAVRLTGDHSVRPIRMNPGVNRGYREVTLDEEFRLAFYTAACSPWVLRGDAFPETHRGDVFVCEPSGNLVKRYELEDRGLGIVAEPDAGPHEFLASTDERFRPVDLRDGPDGNLYVADLYRGVIQHRIFVTSWLRAQVEARGLEQPTGLGRIWRVVPESGAGAPGPDLVEATWTELVATLAHPSGWWRDQAHRLLVEEGPGEPDARELLAEALRGMDAPLGRLHALTALGAIDALSRADVLWALEDGDARVLTAAVRAAELWLAAGDGEVLERVAALAVSADARLAHQVLLSLGEARTRAADAWLARLLGEDASTPERRAAVLSGLFERELPFLERLLSDDGWREPAVGRDLALRLLARCVAREGRGDRLAILLDLVATRAEGPGWQLEALIEGTLAGRPTGPDGQPTFLRLEHEPEALAAILATSYENLAPRAAVLADNVAWPGKPGTEASEVRALTDDERARFARGRQIYAEICTACHLSNGGGAPGLAPPLKHSEWVLGPKERAARIVLHGLNGPMLVNGTEWNLDMPAYSASDEDLAAILTYVRREWGHGAEPVSPDEVRIVREGDGRRARAWTAAELEALE